MAKKKKIEEVYHVEVITKARVNEEGDDWEYLVKWAGYDSDADSWEPSANVQQCNRLLASFWKHVGMDNEDYAHGYEVVAKDDWIEKEKRYFAEIFVKPSKRKSDKATNKKDRQENRDSESSPPQISESSAHDSESLDEKSLAKASVTKKLNRKVRVVDTESESESDGHLCIQAKVAPRPKATAPPLKEVPKGPTQVGQGKLTSATGGPSSIAPPKITAVRTHQDQRANPLVKPMHLPSKSVEAGSSLSTKQRVAAGIPPPATGLKPLPSAPKTSLPSLSFKKNKPLVLPSSQVKDTIVSNIPNASPASPVVQPTNITDDADAIPSPKPMDVDQHVDFFGPILDDAQPLGGSSEIFTASIPPKSQEEINAEKFLQTVHIPVSPLELAAIPDQSSQSVAELTKTLSIPKIPKKWRWSGDLFISTSESKMELLCAVTIADPSGISDSSHVNLLLSSLDSLQISKLHPIMDLSPVLRACGKPRYFGRLESSEPGEEMIMCGLEYHLTSEGLAAAIPLLLDGTEVAVLIIFPGAQQGLTKVLQVPEHLLSGTPLLVVLLPFSVSTMASMNAAGWRLIGTAMQSSFNLRLQDVLGLHEPHQDAILYQAISLLGFPKTLLEFFNSPTSRTYCIWPLPNQLSPGLDTAMLQCILKSTKATLAKLEEDVRIVFISNRHLEMLHTMPSLATKQANSPEIQFWTYGYSANMTSERWRVQEIYPLGGVVTFTSSALAEDLVGCHQLISQIIEHPLWDCYLIPEVLAVSHLLCSDGDPSESFLGPILNYVNLGLISAIRIPQKDHPHQVTWLSQVFNHSEASGHELLEIYLGVLKSHPTTLDMTTEQLISFANNEIIKDHSNAQIQPAFMENYRRFVIIRAATEGTVQSGGDGLEWSSLSLFSFKDDYFQP